ncbi:cobalamin biosynthesis protein CobG [Streptomyces sp. NPDC050145]|uniref:cobalamin biosynthesis protein CobG n=1 Tax=Streptomyces sp. NPDC050145 TaxID=3365602 RepID=UPI0037ABE017
MPSAPIPPGPGTSGTSRGDACPGALRLHAADDGFLARVRVPGGVLGVAQARAVAEAAARFGDGVLHLTSRGNVQVRGLRDGCGGELAEVLGGAGLLPSPAHERVRNVVASPMSGLDGLGFVDVRKWLTGLDAALLASSVTPGLSGRFLFALDDGRGDVAGLGPDVLLRGRPDGSTQLAVGDAEFVVSYEDAARAAVIAAESFLASASEVTGRRVWRVAELGVPLAELISRNLKSAGLHPWSARSAPLGARGTARPATTNAAPGDEPGSRNGGALTVTAPFGSFTQNQWATLTDLADRLPQRELRMTPWRTVVVPGAGPAERPALAAAGLITDPAAPAARLGACIGTPGCAKSLTDVRRDAEPRHRQLPTYWSGCARRCGHPAGPHIDVVAQPDGTYRTQRTTEERAEPRV